MYNSLPNQKTVYFFFTGKKYKNVPSESPSFTGLLGGFLYAADMRKYMVIIMGWLYTVTLATVVYILRFQVHDKATQVCFCSVFVSFVICSLFRLLGNKKYFKDLVR